VALVLAFQDFEVTPEKTRRQQPMDRIGLRVWRTYAVPMEDTATLLPVWGEAVTLNDVSGTGLLSPRVYDIVEGPQLPKEAKIKVAIQFIVPVAYSSTSSTGYQELKGSRVTDTARRRRTAVRIGVTSTSGSVDAPAERDFYPGESGLTALRCIHVVPDDTVRVPGLFFHTAEYAAFQVFRGT